MRLPRWSCHAPLRSQHQCPLPSLSTSISQLRNTSLCSLRLIPHRGPNSVQAGFTLHRKWKSILWSQNPCNGGTLDSISQVDMLNKSMTKTFRGLILFHIVALVRWQFLKMTGLCRVDFFTGRCVLSGCPIMIGLYTSRLLKVMYQCYLSHWQFLRMFKV